LPPQKAAGRQWDRHQSSHNAIDKRIVETVQAQSGASGTAMHVVKNAWLGSHLVAMRKGGETPFALAAQANPNSID